jgi:hypothetical protein
MEQQRRRRRRGGAATRERRAVRRKDDYWARIRANSSRGADTQDRHNASACGCAPQAHGSYTVACLASGLRCAPRRLRCLHTLAAVSAHTVRRLASSQQQRKFAQTLDVHGHMLIRGQHVAEAWKDCSLRMETGCCLPSRPEIVQQPAKIGLLEQALAINLRSHSISTAVRSIVTTGAS